MINLIPNEEKKMMIKDFYYRLVTVILLMLSLVALIASIALLPSYFLSSVKKNVINEQLDKEIVEEISSYDQQTLLAVSALDSKLSLLEKSERDKFLVSDRVISEILSNRISNIKITQISFENNEIKGKQISIRGTAPSRERLTLFRRALESNPLFKEVDLPISNFIKGSNIQFYLSLIPS